MGGRGKKIKKAKRKVPPLPENVKQKLQTGKGDRITAKALGLGSIIQKPGNTGNKKKIDPKNPGNFTRKTRTANKNLEISKLTISSGNLSKSSLLRLENDLAGGYKKSNPKPILVAPIKGKPGQYAVLGKSGNNRIAYAKLSGYTGKVYVKVVSEGRRNLTFKEKAARAAKKASKK
ncbi:MAG TPA: hypothetical protein PLP33_27120 [Leptospiraceae bacterium]|nr:hypothetical protein [Leptospiraceae bacterium]